MFYAGTCAEEINKDIKIVDPTETTEEMSIYP
jgi:hypothetical protein